MEYTEEKKDGKVIIWTEVPEYVCQLGIQFEEGGRLQYYTHARVTTNWEIFTSDAGMEVADRYSRELLSVACERYPKEFAKLSGPSHDYGGT